MPKSLNPIAALAGLTVRDALRRRALAALAVFAPALALVAGTQPLAEPADAPGLLQAVAAMTFAFAMLSVILVTAAFIPRDLKEKTIAVVLTRPLTRSGYVMGRVLGAMAVAAILGVAMSTIAWTYVALRLAAAPAARQGLAAYRVVEPEPLSFALERGGLPVRIPPSAGRQRIDGASGVVATARFAGAASRAWRFDRDGVETMALRLTAAIDGPERHMPLIVRCGNFETTIRLADREAAIVEVPAAKAAWDGDIIVELRPGSPRMAIGFMPGGVHLLQPPAAIVRNALAGAAALVAALAMTAALAVALGTVAGFPVAAATAALLVAMGYFSRELIGLLDVYAVFEAGPGGGFADVALTRLGMALRPLIHGLRLIIPNLAAYDLGPWLARSLAVPWTAVAMLATRSLSMTTLFTAIGCVAMTRREPAGRV